MILSALGLIGTLLVIFGQEWAHPPPAVASGDAVDHHLGGHITISDHDDEQYLPSVAYNWKHHEYLVVWHDKWAIGTRDIRAARLSDTGQVLAEFVVFEHATRDSFQPSVDYDPVNDRYLVAWSFDAFGDGSDMDLYGRFVPWDGPNAALSEFPISTWSTHQWTPRVTYGRSVEEYLVVWVNEYQAGTPPMYISGRRVKADGSGFPGGASDLTISHASEPRINPDVAYNLARNEYLVVYDNTFDIWGLRLTGTLDHDFGGPFTIAGWPDTEIGPAVAACKDANQFLVAWQSDQGSSNDAIYARFIDGDGTMAGVHLIDDTTGAEVEADVACSQQGNRYLLAWMTEYVNGRFGLWSRMANPDETFEPAFAVVHPGQAADRTSPFAAGGHANFLLAWEHQRDGTSYQDIHGRLVTPFAAFLPQALRNAP
jgi:hypothetical protein